ncbi:anthranilate phosphoribosyltransferase, partial [mine drainage metagenome]
RMNYKFEKSQEELAAHLDDTNFAFMLAPYYNEAFAKFFPARKMLTFKTVMNYMGPITNPADPERLVIGTSDDASCDLYADYLSTRRKKGFIVHAEDGMDEISPISTTRAIIVNNGRKEFTVNPRELGIEPIELRPHILQ